MDTTLWILLVVAAAVVLGFVVTMYVLFRRGREDEKHIDYRKVREWKDDKDEGK